MMAACLAAWNLAIHSHRDVFTSDGNIASSPSVRARGSDASVRSQTSSMPIPTTCPGLASGKGDNDALGVGDRDGRQIVSLGPSQVAEPRSAGVIDDRQIGRIARRISSREPEATRGLFGRDPAPEPVKCALISGPPRARQVGLFLRAELDLLQDVPPDRPGHVAWRSEPDGDDIRRDGPPGIGKSSPIKIVSGDRNTSR